MKESNVPPLASGIGSISTTIYWSFVSADTSINPTDGVSGTSASTIVVMSDWTLYPLVVIASSMNLNGFDLSASKNVIV